MPVVVGGELAAAAAYRWKCQFNENAGMLAFAAALPELNHNEIVGWAAVAGRFSAVFLEDPDAHPRNLLRSELSAGQAAAAMAVVERVQARGGTPVERVISLVLLGDLVSLYLAVLNGKDPVEIAAIDALKAELERR